MKIDRFSRDYTSRTLPRKTFPSLRFYARMANILYRAGKLANAGKYSGEEWTVSSQEVGEAIESVGTVIHIEGFSHVSNLQGPAVFVANHMSTLETFFLPCIIQPVRDVTFVVKSALLKYPCLGPVLSSRDPLVVGRSNPREDLAIVLDGGKKHLDAGRSVIIFPQGTRSYTVDEARFSSLGIKLAKKAGVPVIPVALKTDAWGTGSLIKDLGRIRPDIPVHIRFGEALTIHGNGKEEHAQSLKFITESVAGWVAECQALQSARTQ